MYDNVCAGSEKILFDNKIFSSNISGMLLNMQANDKEIKLENNQMNNEELNPLSILWAGEETNANDERMFPSDKDDYILHAAKNKNDDEDGDDDIEDDDDHYNEEKEEEEENPFDKEPTDKDIVEEDIPLIDPEEDIFDDDEEVPYNKGLHSQELLS